MTRQRRIDRTVYVIADFLMAMLAWLCFFVYRKTMEGQLFNQSIFDDPNLWIGLFSIPLGWVLLYSIFDQYQDLYRQSRLTSIAHTFLLTFVGVFFLFFTLILDDFVTGERTYFTSFFTLFNLHFFFTVISRMIWLTRASRRLKQGLVSFNTLLVGGNQNAKDLYLDITNREKAIGYKFIGFIDTNGTSDNRQLTAYLPNLGKIEDLSRIVQEQEIEEVVIAIETSEHNRLKEILNRLFDFGNDVFIKIIPDMYDILLGTVKMNHLYGAVLIDIRQELMPRWQLVIKRAIDTVASAIGLILLAPLLLYIAIRVRLSSEGDIFFLQERIGLNGKPFNIIKFRSMYPNAEQHGPQLSQTDDNRCTPWGAVMRKWRLDELPQFWNVLKGDMSLVGPRPERQYYIDKISEKAPHYKHLLKVRPGITSWGQVKYGYASSVEEMIQRLKFDILYIENMSLSLDFKILFYTVIVLMSGKGK